MDNFDASQKLSGVNRQILDILAMLEVIPQASRKGYSDVVEDHAIRVSRRVSALQNDLTIVREFLREQYRKEVGIV